MAPFGKENLLWVPVLKSPLRSSRSSSSDTQAIAKKAVGGLSGCSLS